MKKNRGRNATVNTARSGRNGREGQKGSHGMHTGQAPNEAAGRPRDLDSGDDDDSGDVCIYVGTVTIRAQGPDRALEASDWSESDRESLQIVGGQKYRSTLRSDEADSSDDSSGADAGSSISDSSGFPMMRRPDPYDGKADPLVFDEWKVRVETWAEVNGLSRKQVMSCFPLLITGWAERCFDLYIARTPAWKWELKEVFETLYEQCCPFDCRLRVHRQLVSARQGNLTVLDFANRIKSLAKHVPYHVDEEFLVTIFYEGLNSPIKAKLAMLKCVPGATIDLGAMIRRARIFEELAHQLL